MLQTLKNSIINIRDLIQIKRNPKLVNKTIKNDYNLQKRQLNHTNRNAGNDCLHNIEIVVLFKMC